MHRAVLAITAIAATTLLNAAAHGQTGAGRGAATRPATRPATPEWVPEGEPVFVYPEGFDATASDPRAIRLAMTSIEAMGGLEAWNAVPGIRFAFVVRRGDEVVGRRLHYWDKFGQRHRIEMQDQDGARLVVTQNLGRQSGQAVRDGSTLEGKELEQALKRAYAAWINDTYWLIMPFKTLDPGVTLSYEGARVRDGQTYQLVRLRFDEVGLTPRDTYLAWIHSETRRMDFWSYHLQSMTEGEPERTFAWREWKPFGAVTLSLHKLQVEGDGDRLSIHFEDVSLPGTLPDQLFDPAATVPAGLKP